MSEKIKCPNPNCDGILEKKSLGYYPIYKCNKCEETVSILEGKMLKKIEVLEEKGKNIKANSELITDLLYKTNSNEKKIETLEKKVKGNGVKIMWIKRKISTLRKDNKELFGLVNDLGEIIEALESALKALAEKIFMNMDNYRKWLKQLETKS